MGVRKILTRVGNLIYIAGAGLACYGFATKPLLNFSVEVAVPGSLLSSVIQEQFGSETTTDGGETNQVYRTKAKRANEPDLDIGKILSEIDMDGIFDNLSLQVNLELPSLVDFLKTPADEQSKVIGSVAGATIDKALDSAYSVISAGFDKLVPEIAKVAAGGAVSEAISGAISQMLGNKEDVGAELDALPEGMVDDLVDNVWNTLTVAKTADVEKTFTTFNLAMTEAQAQLTKTGDEATWANGDIITVKASDTTPEEEIEYYTFNKPTKLVKTEEQTSFDVEYAELKNAYDAVKTTWTEGYIVKITTDPAEYYAYETLTLRKSGLSTTVDDVVTVIQDSINTVFESLATAEGLDQETKDAFAGQTVDQEVIDEVASQMGEMLQSVGLANENGEIQDMDKALAAMLEMFMGGGSSDDDSEDSHKTKLDTPTNFVIESDGITWDEVTGAGTYEYSINNGETVPTSQPKALITFSEQPSEFTLSVKAIAANSETHVDSELGSITINNSNPAAPEIIVPEPKGGDASIRRISRDGGNESTVSTEDLIKQFVDPLLADLPLDEITTINLDDMLGFKNATLYIYAGITALAALPWLLFALFTLIRTLRPKKCWAKPWFIFVFCFLEVILGAGLTLGLKYGLSAATPVISGMMVGDAEKFAPILEGIKIVFEMNCLLASYVYLAMIPFTIIYIIIAHGPKKEYKIWKKSKKYAKKISKGKMTMAEVPEKYQEQTQNILDKKAAKGQKAPKAA